MTHLLMIFDTWLVMVAATLFVWFGTTSILTGNVPSSDVTVSLLGGFAGVCSAGVLGVWRGHWKRQALILLRLVMIGCLAYFAWFQGRPWFTLDDSALVRGSFRQEFFRQRQEQLGSFLLIVVPLIALGVWHGRVLPVTKSAPLAGRTGVAVVVGLVGTSGIAGLAARLIGVPTLWPSFWIAGAIASALLLFGFARRVNSAEFPAFVAFSVFIVAVPVVLLWP